VQKLVSLTRLKIIYLKLQQNISICCKSIDIYIDCWYFIPYSKNSTHTHARMHARTHTRKFD